jgi:hypothetical protein
MLHSISTHELKAKKIIKRFFMLTKEASHLIDTDDVMFRTST